MSITNTFIFFISVTAYFQAKDITYYIADKGIYVTLESRNTKKKIPYKENSDFYFSIKNDSTALIQDIYGHTLQAIKEYKICNKFDTAYVKNYTIINGKQKGTINRIVFKKIY